MELSHLSAHFTVRALTPADIPVVYRLAAGNPTYYRYHPPFVTEESLLEDLTALPPGKTLEDKAFIGFWNAEGLTAVADIVVGYPDLDTVWIGWLILDASRQGKGIASGILSEIEMYFSERGYTQIKLAVDKGNPQSLAFWSKNGFTVSGSEIPNDFSAYIPMQKFLHLN